MKKDFIKDLADKLTILDEVINDLKKDDELLKSVKYTMKVYEVLTDNKLIKTTLKDKDCASEIHKLIMMSITEHEINRRIKNEK